MVLFAPDKGNETAPQVITCMNVPTTVIFIRTAAPKR